MKKLEKEKGITLIALIVTIIILLVLAGVAIVTLTGENGLLKRANDTVEKTKEAEAAEVIELQLISCRVEYTLNSNVNISEYVGKENKQIKVEVDSSLNPDNNPVGQWTMTYREYEFEINDLQIQDYYKTGSKIKPTIKDKKVTEEYQFASRNGSKVDIEFKVELPTGLAGAIVNVNVTSQATGTANGNYDSATGMYTGTITTDGTTNPNGTYTYEVKATKDGKEYIVKTTAKISKFLDSPEIEIPEDGRKRNELKIKVTNGYPTDANISYKYYISETTTYGAENFTTDTEITKTGLKTNTQYNIKVEAYLSDKISKDEAYVLSNTSRYLLDGVELTDYYLYHFNHLDVCDLLTNGILQETVYAYNGVLMINNTGDFLELNITKQVEIEIYYQSYGDSAGSTSDTKLIKSIYDPPSDVSTELERIPTNAGDWISLGIFTPGYYRITCDKNYASISEMRVKQ